MRATLSISFFPVATVSTALLLALPWLGESSSRALWPAVGLLDLLFLILLMRIYKAGGTILLALLFMFSYYLSPIPYFLLGIPIVPYADLVGYRPYMVTWCIMSAFLGYLLMFSRLMVPRATADDPVHDPGDLPKRNWGRVALVYWLAVFVFIAATFRGVSVVNASGADNYLEYVQNLKTQSGALEYFLVLVVLGFSLSRTRLDKACYFLATSYYLYFAFTRGYRVQMTEMIFLLVALHFRRYLTVKRCVLLTAIGFVLLQALGAMKHGISDPAALFGIMAGEQVRTNQTEVFYTSNNVLNPVVEGKIPVTERASSLAVAMVAAVLPGNFLPDNWQTSISSHAVTHLPGGGGGFIAGHFYYWLSGPGVLLASLLIAGLFCAHLRGGGRRMELLTTLLIATCPRWIAYEPIAMFFRLGLYFLIADMTFTSLESLFRSLAMRERLA